MCSKNNSDSTYCSEVEELLKANSSGTSVLKKKFCAKEPLRRSQRLSQKHNKPTRFSETKSARADNKEVANIENSGRSNAVKNHKFDENIFVNKATNQRYYVAQVISGGDVPLDLSLKSKVLKEETSQLVESVVTITGFESKSCNKNNIVKLATNNTDGNSSKIFSKGLKRKSIGKQARKPSENHVKKARKMEAISTINDLKHTKNISSHNSPQSAERFNTAQSLNDVSKIISGKRVTSSKQRLKSNKSKRKAERQGSPQILNVPKTRRMTQSLRTIAKSNNLSLQLDRTYKKIESLRCTSSKMYVKRYAEAKPENLLAKTVTKNVQKNSTAVKRETSTSVHASYSQSCSELESNRTLRNVTNIRKKSENESQKVKMEMTSQNASFSKKSDYVAHERKYEDLLNKNQLNNILSRSDLKSADVKMVKENLNCAHEIDKTDNNTKVKAKLEPKNATMNKNYIKSFDKSIFLDKIQSSRNDIERKNNYSISKTFEVLPTPAECSQGMSNKSIRPEVGVPHLKNKLPTELEVTSAATLRPHPSFVVTPEDTICSELLESSSSSPSLPESLCELFQTKDIKDIFNLETTSYRLYNYHIQALALVLNLRLEYLSKVLDKIIKISPNVLKNIGRAVKMPFVADDDIFAPSPVRLCTSNDIVYKSQSSTERINWTLNDKT